MKPGRPDEVMSPSPARNAATMARNPPVISVRAVETPDPDSAEATDLKAGARPLMPSLRSFRLLCTVGARNWPSCSFAVSSEPLNDSMAPAVPDMRAAATSLAAFWSLVAAMYREIPAAPSFISTVAARVASLPKMVESARVCCSSDRPLSLSLSCWAMLVMGRNWPDASVNFRPRSDIAPAAAVVDGTRRVSIVFSDVPASEPLMPAASNDDRIPTVSCSVRPAVVAPGPTCERASPSDSTLAEEAFAPPARAAATAAMSLPLSWNVLSALEAMVDAVARSVPPAAARVSVPSRAPLWMVAADRPPLASSSIAPPASPALKVVSAPILSARSDRFCISAAGTLATAAIVFIVWEKLASRLTASTPR
jgi:hypothetical protein